MCTETFGSQYNIDYIKKAVSNTVIRYGGRDNYRGTNVVAPNGSLDPWHALGLYNHTDPSVVTYLINGESFLAIKYRQLIIILLHLSCRNCSLCRHGTSK